MSFENGFLGDQTLPEQATEDKCINMGRELY